MESAGFDTIPDETAEVQEEEYYNEDVGKLFDLWHNEKYAPELLPFNKEIVENISEVVEFVGDDLDEQRAEKKGCATNDLSHVIRSVDLERVRYVLRDYLRIRVWKISQWPQHYLERENIALLSDAENTFLQEFWQLKSGFLHHRLLGAMPASKQNLDDKIDLLDMVRRPVLDKHVYARIKGDLGKIELPPSVVEHSQGTQSSQLELHEGQTYLVRWCLVRKFLMNKDLEGKVQLV